MAIEKQYRTIVPVEPGTDEAVVRWLAAESFHAAVSGDSMMIVDYTEATLGAGAVAAAIRAEGGNPADVAAALGRPLEDFDWWAFTANARVDDALMGWLAAECAWRNEQIGAWLGAERTWKAAHA